MIIGSTPIDLLIERLNTVTKIKNIYFAFIINKILKNNSLM